MLICKLQLSCRDAEEQSWFCEAELLKLSAHPANLPTASAVHAPHMPLLSTSSPHIPQPSCLSKMCQLPESSAALRPFLPQQAFPFMSRHLLPPSSSLKGRMNSANLSVTFSQKGAPSPMKWDNPWDSTIAFSFPKEWQSFSAQRQEKDSHNFSLRAHESNTCETLCP